MATEQSLDLRRIVDYQVGKIELMKDRFTERQRAFMERVLEIADKSPSLDWRADKQNHNRDFMLLKNRDGVMSIEFVKEFMQKVTFSAGISTHTGGETWVDLPPAKYKVWHEDNHYTWEQSPDKGCTVTMTGWSDDNPEHKVTRSGGASMVECGYPSDARAYHNTIARAQTRAMKILIEELMGAPFLNYLILLLFGGYEVVGQGVERPPKPKKERDVTESVPKEAGGKTEFDRLPAACKKIIASMIDRIRKETAAGRYVPDDMSDWRSRWRAVADNEERLRQLSVELDREIDERRRR